MSKKILIVDDETDIRSMVQWELKGQGYQVLTASDGREALEQIAIGQPDLVVLDVGLPGMDGFEVLQKVRADPATAVLPVIMLTAQDQSADVAQGWKAGADLYFAKPFEPRELLEAIGRLLAGDVSAFPPGPIERKF